jgi:hypothetical protein
MKMNAQKKRNTIGENNPVRFVRRNEIPGIGRLELWMVLILVIPMILSACGSVSALAGAIPTSGSGQNHDSETFADRNSLFEPEEVRDAAFNFVQENYRQSVQGVDGDWDASEIQASEVVGSVTYHYQRGSWVAQVNYPVVATEAAIYTVNISEPESGFAWEGLVDLFGQVATISVSSTDPTDNRQDSSPTPSDPPVIRKFSYRDDLYQLAMEYPADWSLQEISVGNNLDAKALRLQKGVWILMIHYKFLWDDSTFGGGLPAGEILERGWTALLSRSVPRQFVVYEGKDKVMFYGGRYEDIEIHVRLDADIDGNIDYSAVDLPDHIIDEAQNIAANIIRTGPPISPPVPTPTSISPTSTPFPVPCNIISFQADLTIPDGTIFAPNAAFVKTWRLKNVGTCSWDKNYDLVFVEGDRMDGAKAIALPEKIRPGEKLDISVVLTSPSKAGEYRGYWMLRSDDGEWFGDGKSANKAFWVDIEVIEPESDNKYDFTLNLCAATWRSEAMRLPCPGFSASDEGFAQMLKNPKLENRNENEPAIWVHPNEEKHGWLEGIYPSIKIKDGDHFKAWVGCIQGFDKCSLMFYLDYQDDNGKVHRLGEWNEVYDGMVTTVDIDLSELAGNKVRFVLGVEAITKNVEDAQGFWFVPRVTQGN